MSDNSEDKSISTKLAEDRTILANERTFASRMGLALGNLGLAVGLQAVFGAADPTWLAKLAASVFIGIAILIAFGGYTKSKKMLERLSTYRAEPASTRGMLIITVLIILGALLIGIILWAI